MPKHINLILGLTLIICSVQINGQSSLPAFTKIEGKSFYAGIYNNVSFSLNGSSTNDIAIKCSESNIKPINDTTYQVFLRNPSEEVKIKLYYKNLPVDIYTLPVISQPKVNVSLESGKNEINITDLSSEVLKIGIIDPTVEGDGFRFHNCKVTVASDKPAQFLILYENSLQKIERLVRASGNKTRLVVTDLTLKNAQNQILKVDANALEISIVK